MSQDHWIIEAVNQAFLDTPYGDLCKAAGIHVQAEGTWAPRLIRPSLIGDPCRLSRVKRYLGHEAIPGWSAVRQGVKSQTTAMNFARGTLMEGLIVAALKTRDLNVVGVSPELLFACPGMEAHPDMMIDLDGELELIQMKNPSVFAFDRMEKKSFGAFDRYIPQIACEMYIGRQMGHDIKRSHLLMVTWEGYMPSQQRGDELRMVCETFEWNSDMEAIVDEAVTEIAADVEAAEAGDYPVAFPSDRKNTYPCSYCAWDRDVCEEVPVPVTLTA